MENPVSRLQRVLEELPQEFLPNIGLQATVMLGVKPKIKPGRDAEGNPDGVTVRLPTPREICQRVKTLTGMGRMSPQFLIMSLLRGLERGFVEQKKEAERISDVDLGLDMLQSLKNEASRPLDDREIFRTDAELAALMSTVKGQMTTGPQKQQSTRKALSAIRRIIAEEFPDSYWNELGYI